jgi:hypothetical protein
VALGAPFHGFVSRFGCRVAVAASTPVGLMLEKWGSKFRAKCGFVGVKNGFNCVSCRGQRHLLSMMMRVLRGQERLSPEPSRLRAALNVSS